ASPTVAGTGAGTGTGADETNWQRRVTLGAAKGNDPERVATPAPYATQPFSSIMPELYRSLGVAVSALRWMTLVTLFFLAVLQPRTGRFGIINWQLILIFAGYNLLAEFILDFGFWMLDYKPTPIHNLKPKIQNKQLWRVI